MRAGVLWTRAHVTAVRVALIALAAASGIACELLLPVHEESEPEDAGVPNDVALTDAGPETAQDAEIEGGFCASLSPTPAFCDDFDEGNPVDLGWSPVGDSGGTVALDSLFASSRPNSVLSIVPANPGPCTYAWLYRSSTTTVTHAHLAFDVRLGDNAGDGGFATDTIARLKITHNGLACSVLLKAPQPGFLQLGEQDTPVADGGFLTQMHLSTGKLVVGAWSRVQIDMDTSTSLPTVNLSVGGASVLPPDQTALYASCSGAGTGAIGVGSNCQDTEATLRFDNVVYDESP